MSLYTIYKITNLINQKYYIGKHKTNNIYDEYMGSGILIQKAIKKYGKEHFKKEVLFVFNTEEEANIKEKEIINYKDSMCYNMNIGGIGGFQYINENGLSLTPETIDKKRKAWNEERKKHQSEKMIGNDYAKNKNGIRSDNQKKGDKIRSLKLKGKLQSKEHIENKRQSMLGAKKPKQSEKMKLKIACCPFCKKEFNKGNMVLHMKKECLGV